MNCFSSMHAVIITKQNIYNMTGLELGSPTLLVRLASLVSVLCEKKKEFDPKKGESFWIYYNAAHPYTVPPQVKISPGIHG